MISGRVPSGKEMPCKTAGVGDVMMRPPTNYGTLHVTNNDDDNILLQPPAIAMNFGTLVEHV